MVRVLLYHAHGIKNMKTVTEKVQEIIRQTHLIAMISKHMEKSHWTASTEEERKNVEEELDKVYVTLRSIYEDQTS